MKKMTWFMAIALAAALATAACDNGTTGGGDTGNPNSVTYTSYDSKGKEYKLVITKGTDSPGTDPGVIVGPGGPGVYRDSGLVNGANDVWADSYPAGDRDGFIFKADGTVHLIDDYTNTTPGVWKIFGTGTWYNTVITGSSNRLTFTGNGSSMTYQYTVTATTLTLTDSDGESQTFTKTTASVSGRSAVSPAPAEKTGTKAITGAIKRAVSADLGSPAGRAAAGRAAYKPKSGDEFTLTIKDMLTGDTEGTSTGTVTDISSDGDGDTLTLDNDDKEFTVKVKDLFIEEITGPIPLDNGSEWEKPDTLYPNDPNNPSNGPKKWTAVKSSAIWEYTDNKGKTETVGIKAIAYGGGRWVAGGEQGKMAYSTDNGVTWTAVTNSTLGTQGISAIAYGNGRFVAGGLGMAYSTNGESWTTISNPFGSVAVINVIVYGNNRFIAGCISGKMAYSDDGVTWTAVANSPFGDNSDYHVSGIAYGGGTWVACSSTTQKDKDDDRKGTIAYSKNNGVTWTPVTKGAAFQYTQIVDGKTYTEESGIYAIAYGNNRFIAVCGSTIAYSADGINWTGAYNVLGTYTGKSGNFTVTVGMGLISNAFAYGSGRFVGVTFDFARGEESIIAYSADGISNWTTVPNSSQIWYKYSATVNGTTYTVYSIIRAIAYGNGRFIAVGEDGKMAYADWP